jgi:hypothetical protein
VTRRGVIAWGVALLVACGGGPLPRETIARNTRTDDPWLEGGDVCLAGIGDDPGLHIQTVEAGTGKVVGDGETVRVHYVATLASGAVVHDTHDGPPVEIILGHTRILCGVQRALVGMRAGEQRRAEVPSRLAFGDAGKPPDVPPRSDLVFVLDLYLPAMTGAESSSPPPRPANSRGGGGRGAGGH